MPEYESTFFRHCEKPTLSPIQGKVTGTIPKWLKGTLIRNGPGIRYIGEDEYAHAFDGLSLLQSFNVENGQATYMSRPLESEIYKKNMAAQRIVVTGFGVMGFRDPCDALFRDLKTDFVEGGTDQQNKSIEDNCHVNVCYYGDQLYALTEASCTRRIDQATLKTIGGPVNLTEYVAINRTTAHPHVLENGDTINMGNRCLPGGQLTYVFIRVPPKFDTEETCFKDVEIIAEIPSRHAHTMAYYHSFAIAGDKLIFVEAPLWINLIEKEEGKKPMVKLLEWNAEEKTRFYVVSMTTGQLHPVVYETEGLFTIHHGNAYEEDGQVVIDLAGYDTGKILPDHLEKGTIDKIYNSGGSGRRYVLPLNFDEKSNQNLVTLKNTRATAHVVKTGDSVVINVRPHIFYSSWMEFPRINYKLNGKKYRYFYGNSTTTKLEERPAYPEPNVLIKFDLETDTFVTWAEPNAVTPEPIFVPNPDGTEEEDGVLVVPLMHLNNQVKTTLLILDAKTFTEVGRIEFDAEGVVTPTFHGQWATKGDRIHFL